MIHDHHHDHHDDDPHSSQEKHIEEFFVLSWSEDGRFIIAGGKLKSRTSWSLQDEDCHILPCPLKVFNITSGEVSNPSHAQNLTPTQVVETLHGHEEEILCLKRIKFDGETFLISGSEDGRMIKWKMNRDYGLVKKEMMDDLTTNMVISLTFVPDCGNRYYLASSDTDIKLFDFQHGKVISSSIIILSSPHYHHISSSYIIIIYHYHTSSPSASSTFFLFTFNSRHTDGSQLA